MALQAPENFREGSITHSEDFQEELGGHQQVQVDLGRAEGVGLGISNKWLRGGTVEKFPSMGRLNFPLAPEEEVSSGSSYESVQI